VTNPAAPTPTPPYALFWPNGARAVQIDQRARASLADSLGSVFDACRAHLTADEADQTALLAALRSHRVAPAVFGVYADLVDALFAEDYTTAQELLSRLVQPIWRERVSARVVTLDDTVLGAGVAGLYRRGVDDDPNTSVSISAVDDVELARGRALHDEATRLLRDVAPDLHAEIAALAHETVLVRDASEVGEPSIGFDGASTFYLWGAVVLNITRQQRRTGLAVALAHEVGHVYLLGSTLGAPLVDNDPSERYVSPLRADPRPMDGLVHASFVLARMIWCQDRMLASGLLSGAEQQEVCAERALNHARFTDSAPLISSHARFTDIGRELWTAARDWVADGCAASRGK